MQKNILKWKVWKWKSNYMKYNELHYHQMYINDNWLDMKNTQLNEFFPFFFKSKFFFLSVLMVCFFSI